MINFSFRHIENGLIIKKAIACSSSFYSFTRDNISMYKTALGAFKQIDRHLFACARTLVASENRIFWQIMLPLGKPGVIAGTLLAFARALGEFGATLMLAGSIPGKTETIPIAIFLAAEGGFKDKWLELKEHPLPWKIQLNPLRIMLLTPLNKKLC